MNTMHTIISNSAVQAKAETVKKAPTGRLGNPDSKAAKCREYFKANPGLARKDLIKAFVDDYGMTKDGAATYVYNFRKAVKEGKL